MGKMNRSRAGGGDDDFADVGDEPTFAARYAGRCATCKQRFAVGDPIAAVAVDKTTTYHHGACRYSATAFLSQHADDADMVDVAATHNSPERCRGTTKRGRPCSNAPQKGEHFCGPHLTQHLAGRRSEDT